MKVIREHVLWKSLKREFLVGLSSYGKDAEMYAPNGEHRRGRA